MKPNQAKLHTTVDMPLNKESKPIFEVCGVILLLQLLPCPLWLRDDVPVRVPSMEEKDPGKNYHTR